MKKYLIVSALGVLCALDLFSQNQYVEASVSSIDGETFGIVKLTRKDNRIKMKYFAAKDEDGTAVYERYRKWSNNKKIVALSSGTYMTNCNPDWATEPVGLCIDQGNIVNRNLIINRLDALAIVYATGGIAASNLSEGNLSIKWPDGSTEILNIRGNASHKVKFLDWSTQVEATVFQTHLFVYKDQITMAQNAKTTSQERRFLAVCIVKDAAGKDQINYYLINLPTPSTILNGVNKAYRILKELEEVHQIVFMINLDTGCQNVFSVYNDKGVEYQDEYLKGKTSINNSINLVALYYE